jgi:hypothetical protein
MASDEESSKKIVNCIIFELKDRNLGPREDDGLTKVLKHEGQA